jgi:hypothetical protein
MPLEVYLGAAVGVIILVLLASLFRGRPRKRRVVQQNSGTDQVAIQLSRIADALEALVLRLRVPPPHVEQTPESVPSRVEQASEPVQHASESSSTAQTKVDEPADRHVNLSMFGR